MEVAEVDAPEQRKVSRSLLSNPQVNSSFSSCALVFVDLPRPSVEFLAQRMYAMLQRTLSALNPRKSMNH